MRFLFLVHVLATRCACSLTPNVWLHDSSHYLRLVGTAERQPLELRELAANENYTGPHRRRLTGTVCVDKMDALPALSAEASMRGRERAPTMPSQCRLMALIGSFEHAHAHLATPPSRDSGTYYFVRWPSAWKTVLSADYTLDSGQVQWVSWRFSDDDALTSLSIAARIWKEGRVCLIITFAWKSSRTRWFHEVCMSSQNDKRLKRRSNLTLIVRLRFNNRFVDLIRIDPPIVKSMIVRWIINDIAHSLITARGELWPLEKFSSANTILPPTFHP